MRSTTCTRLVYVPHWAISFEWSEQKQTSTARALPPWLVVLTVAASRFLQATLWCKRQAASCEGVELRPVSTEQATRLLATLRETRATDVDVPIDTRLDRPCFDDTKSLKALAFERFVRFGVRLQPRRRDALAARPAKRSRSESLERASRPGDGTESDSSSTGRGGGPCVVCFGGFVDGRARSVACRLGVCSALACDECSARCRGLCPICDRSILSANYECGCCRSLVRLHEFGHACDTCEEAVLCQSCHIKRRECRGCECACFIGNKRASS